MISRFPFIVARAGSFLGCIIPFTISVYFDPPSFLALSIYRSVSPRQERTISQLLYQQNLGTDNVVFTHLLIRA
jgi:hypothetical protein